MIMRRTITTIVNAIDKVLKGWLDSKEKNNVDRGLDVVGFPSVFLSSDSGVCTSFIVVTKKLDVGGTVGVSSVVLLLFKVRSKQVLGESRVSHNTSKS